MRFLADMGISPKTVVFLSDLGHDAIHLRSQGLQRMPDPAILQKAQSEQRILLTHDLDFSDLLAASGSHLPSVLIFRLRNMQPERVNHFLKAVLETQSDAIADGAIVSITEGQIRIRLLPIDSSE